MAIPVVKSLTVTSNQLCSSLLIAVCLVHCPEGLCHGDIILQQVSDFPGHSAIQHQRGREGAEAENKADELCRVSQQINPKWDASTLLSSSAVEKGKEF